jgi:hypothetical protein
MDRRELTVVLSWFAGPVNARWYNPTSGQSVNEEGSPFANRETRLFYTPGNNGTRSNDWILILEAK